MAFRQLQIAFRLTAEDHLRFDRDLAIAGDFDEHRLVLSHVLRA
jgi:hypothetical protein